MFIDRLAAEIRLKDGNHDLGAAALAEALAPFIAETVENYLDRLFDAIDADGYDHDLSMGAIASISVGFSGRARAEILEGVTP